MEQFPDADLMIASDHGAGPLHGDVNVGAWLASRGHAAYGGRDGSRLVRLAWAFPPSLRKFAKRVAPGAAQKTFASTLAGQLGPFEWSNTRAFVGFHGDLWLNLEGREPQGSVTEADVEPLLADISGGLAALVDPERDEPVFGRVLRGSDLFWGPASHLAPDLMLDSWSSGYRVAPGRDRTPAFIQSPAPLAGVDEAWSSDHRPDGIFAAAGPRIARGASDELSLMDVCPTVLALLERPVPAGLDGRVVAEALAEEFLRAHPATEGAPMGERTVDEGEYSDREAAAVAEHLKDLGYIE
jgi:predicted AlkP superfamily phosphohydrolase/phosphomutase